MAMRKGIAVITALFRREASIEYVDKTFVSRPPGDVTDLNHN
jgi:hypothetical protein